MYIRFVVDEISESSERELGIFQAAYRLLDEDLLNRRDAETVESIRWWFHDNLEAPPRFTAAKPPYYRKKRRVISWFKDSAAEHISRIRQLAGILERYNVHVRMLKTEKPGYVVYEDEFQIAAEPFADTY